MLAVADHLEAHCWNTKDEQERDQFARSAFNRYYYAVYLTIRDALTQIDPAWDEPSHSQVPRLLRETVVKRINSRRKKVAMQGQQAQKLAGQGCTAAKALAQLVDECYTIRVVADYDPNQLVMFGNSVITLAGVKASSARQWCKDAKTRSTVLVNAAKKLGL